MKVIYKQTVSEKIREAAVDAIRRGKKIERIEVTNSEMGTLAAELRAYTLFSNHCVGQNGGLWCHGVWVVCV